MLLQFLLALNSLVIYANAAPLFMWHELQYDDEPQATTQAADWPHEDIVEIASGEGGGRFAWSPNRLFAEISRMVRRALQSLREPTNAFFESITNNVQLTKKRKKKQKPDTNSNATNNLNLGPLGSFSFSFGFMFNFEFSTGMGRLYAYLVDDTSSSTVVITDVMLTEQSLSNVIVIDN